MRDPEAFDAFYAAARGRLLLQTYALTGDLPAARDAVRAAFVAAWHHWPKVERRGDPEAWVRPDAWRRAQRRHQARPWHRERSLEEESRTTLEALGALSDRQRKALLLTQLSSVTMREMAREVGVTDQVAAEQLQEATSRLCLALGVEPAELRPRLQALADELGGTRFPDAVAVRRAGTRRRRLHTVVGVAASVVLVLGAGAAVHDGDAVAPLLGDQVETDDAPPPEPRLQRGDLLAPAEVDRAVAPRRTKGSGTLDNNTTDTGIYAPCQAQPFAVAGGEGQALVRRLRLTGKPNSRTVQSVEAAPDATAAHAAYERMQTWFVDCQTPRVQLLAVHQLEGVGDEGTLLTLRGWESPVTTHQAAVVRTGRLVSLVLLERRGTADPKLEPMLALAGDAVRRLCSSEISAAEPGTCVAQPEARRIPPPPTRRAVGMLQVIDLPPVPGAPEPWVGVKPVRATENPAATRCDNTTFTTKAMQRARTRTFVILDADLPKEFGLTETMGHLPSAKAAKSFVAGVRERVAKCAEDDLTVTVARLGHHARGKEEVTWWRIDTEVSDTRTFTQLMAVARHGRTVAQVGFTPAGRRTLAEGGFDGLAIRALKRLGNISAP